MGAITDWGAYARQVAQTVHLPPPKPEDPRIDLGKIKTDYEANNTELEQTRHEIESLADDDPKYLEKLNKYQELLDKQQKLLAQVEQARDQGPPPGSDGTEGKSFYHEIEGLEQKLGASIHGDNDGDATDGAHTLGQGRYLVRIGDPNASGGTNGSMFGSAHGNLGEAADEGRTANLNRNKYDPNSADGNMDSSGRDQGSDGNTLRDADLVHDGDFVVVGTKPEYKDAANVSDSTDKLDPQAQQAVTGARQKHANDPSFQSGMDDLVVKLAANQPPLTPEQQKDAVDRYERMVGKLPTVPLSPEAIAKNQENLRTALASPEFQKLSGDAKNKYEELYIKYGQDPKKLEGLNNFIKNSGIQDADPTKQKQMLDTYDSDGNFASQANKIASDPNLKPEQRKAALDQLLRIATGKSYQDAGDKKAQIMDNVYKLVTSDEFKNGDAKHQTEIIDYMFTRGFQAGTEGAKATLDEGPKNHWKT